MWTRNRGQHLAKVLAELILDIWSWFHSLCHYGASVFPSGFREVELTVTGFADDRFIDQPLPVCLNFQLAERNDTTLGTDASACHMTARGPACPFRYRQGAWRRVQRAFQRPRHISVYINSSPCVASVGKFISREKHSNGVPTPFTKYLVFCFSSEPRSHFRPFSFQRFYQRRSNVLPSCI